MDEEADLDGERIRGMTLVFQRQISSKMFESWIKGSIEPPNRFSSQNLDILSPKTGLNAAEMPYFVAIKSKPIHVRNVENYTHSH